MNAALASNEGETAGNVEVNLNAPTFAVLTATRSRADQPPPRDPRNPGLNPRKSRECPKGSLLRVEALLMLTALSIAWRAACLLAFLYLTYGCMYLAPQARLRRWGMITWWQLSQENPETFWQKR